MIVSLLNSGLVAHQTNPDVFELSVVSAKSESTWLAKYMSEKSVSERERLVQQRVVSGSVLLRGRKSNYLVCPEVQPPFLNGGCTSVVENAFKANGRPISLSNNSKLRFSLLGLSSSGTFGWLDSRHTIGLKVTVSGTISIEEKSKPFRYALIDVEGEGLSDSSLTQQSAENLYPSVNFNFPSDSIMKQRVYLEDYAEIVKAKSLEGYKIFFPKLVAELEKHDRVLTERIMSLDSTTAEGLLGEKICSQIGLSSKESKYGKLTSAVLRFSVVMRSGADGTFASEAISFGLPLQSDLVPK
jgi:hypothetical protein